MLSKFNIRRTKFDKLNPQQMNWKMHHRFDFEKDDFTMTIEHLYDYKLSNLWSINADITLEMMTNNRKIINKQMNCNFNHHSTLADFGSFCTLRESIENGNIKDHHNIYIYIQARIQVNTYEGIQDSFLLRNDRFGTVSTDINKACILVKSYNIDSTVGSHDIFLHSIPASAVTIHVEEDKFNVDRQGLLCISSTFRKMLTESDSDEIHLDKEINSEHFYYFLQLLYHRKQVITNKNVEGLLDIAVTFDIQFLINDCEDFLLFSKECSVHYKLWIAAKFELSKLQAVLLENISIDDIENFNKEFGREMGKRTMDAFMMKICNEYFEPSASQKTAIEPIFVPETSGLEGSSKTPFKIVNDDISFSEEQLMQKTIPARVSAAPIKPEMEDKWSLLGRLVTAVSREIEANDAVSACHLSKEVHELLFKYQMRALSKAEKK